MPAHTRNQLRLLNGVAFVFLNLSAICIASNAMAQTVAAPQEVIVTAQKREQDIQTVPVDVTAVSADRLTQAGVNNIKDLEILTPGLTVTSSTSEASTTARIRGLSA